MFILWYTGLPEVTVVPSNQSVDVISTATFYAVVRGVDSDMFTYQWGQGRRNIPGANGPVLKLQMSREEMQVNIGVLLKILMDILLSVIVFAYQ